jgi:hypothetical protein
MPGRPAQSPEAFAYIACDIPPGMTLADWARARKPRGRRRRLRRLTRTLP